MADIQRLLDFLKSERVVALHVQTDNEKEQRQELDATALDTSSKTNLLTAIGIGLFVGFIGTAFIMNLMTYWTSFMASLVNGAIGSIFGMIGSVTSYAFSGSKRAVWIGAIIGAIVIPGSWLFVWIVIGT